MERGNGSVQLRYGKETVELRLPAQTRELTIREPEVEIDELEFTKELVELLKGRTGFGSISMVVADKTRLCGYGRILPWITSTLLRLGADREQMVFHIAYGTHPRQSDEECLAAYGETYRNFRFVHHDCHDREAFVNLGTTRRGTRAMIRRDVLESDLILTIGAVSHHYFAGYGGGRKLLFPGIAARESIYANHRLFLDRENGCLSTGCWPGNLEGNPLAADLKEVNDLLPDYLSIHAILNSKGEPAKYRFGKKYDDFLSVCRELDSYYKIDDAERFDTVIVSAGGYPKDINMIQVHKTIHNAANFVKDGGELIVVAECVDGIGSSTFLPYFKLGGWQNTFETLVADYAGNGGTALAMMDKTSRITIKMLTSLSGELCEEIGVVRCLRQEVANLMDGYAGSVALIPNGSLLIADRLE